MLLGTLSGLCFDRDYLRRLLYPQGLKDMMLLWRRFRPLEYPAIRANKFAQVHAFQGLADVLPAIINLRFSYTDEEQSQLAQED
ncbi:hypothetical protein, partial [Moorella sulfitireducens (nom. illeg.)]|uniref:hypothetical protein n=1 Tax=Neomoorella sulfitireducens TaxID=2972948 RepID=UPI0021ACD5BE